jgi:hypothetical protein
MKSLMVLSIALLPVYHTLLAQSEVVPSEGEATIEWTPDKSEIQVKKEAEEAATVDAIERAFGRIVIQSNSTYLQNINTGEKTETTTVFNSISGSDVKGEVVEVSGIRFEEIEEGAIVEGKKSKIRSIHCIIRVKVKPVTERMPDFKANTLNCPDNRCSTTSFDQDETLFVGFSSPESGYLMVFLDDGKVCQQLLPYRRMPEKYRDGYPVQADREYILFNKKDSNLNPEIEQYVDEYNLRAENQMDQLRLFVLYGSTPLKSLTTSEGDSQRLLEQAEQTAGYRLPRETTSESFQRWLIDNQRLKKDLRVMRMDITVTKN